MRTLICYGGPLDGLVMKEALEVPEGYTDYGTALIIWHAVKVELIWPTTK